MPERYLSVSIDTECDKGRGWKVEKPLAFTGVIDGVRERLQPLFRRYKAKPTYLISPEVLRDARSVEALRSVSANGTNAELGTHLHGDLMDVHAPSATLPDVTSEFQRDYAEDKERDMLTTLTRLFESTFDTKPRSFRAGRFGIGAHTIGILESLDYAVESSVTPHVEWSSAGAPGLDFRGAPTQPYHPDSRNPEKIGGSAIWEIPVTIRARAASRLPIVGKIAERILEPAWLRPTHGTGDDLVAITKAECEEAESRAKERPTILNAMFHNVEVVPGKSPYATDEREARAILSRLETLLRFCEKESIQVVGLADVAEILSR